jgi:hypothetical protein
LYDNQKVGSVMSGIDGFCAIKHEYNTVWIEHETILSNARGARRTIRWVET